LDAELAGLVVPGAVVSFSGKGRKTERCAGELLLTHGGVSGPAILDLSASVNEALARGGEAALRVQWVAESDRGWWLNRFAHWRERNGGAAMPTLLKDYLPGRLARWLCRKAGAETGAANLSGPGRDKLADFLSAFPLRIADSEGWDRAMITRGGVDVRDVDPKTLASRVTPGLFFVGEMLDVDGPCGGYNLHWAFASGALAGMSSVSG
jgi:predicted Rossmann fold flavoprotein